MKNAILLHGMPGKDEYYSNHESASNSHWFPWLQNQLLTRDIAAQTPEVPNSWKPYYPDWLKEFERYEITSETILVGHSCGAGFIIRWLSEHKDVRVGKVLLVAPWLDPDREVTTDFFEFTIDSKLTERTEKTTVFYSDNDFDFIQKSMRVVREALPDASYREFHNYGHFCKNDMGTDEFPELLEGLGF